MMKIEERQDIIGKLNAAITEAWNGKTEKLGTILADIVRDKTFGNYAFDIWHTCDVKAHIDRLTDDQAQQVLEYANKKCDGGLSLDVFDTVADQLFPEPVLVDFCVTTQSSRCINFS